MSELKELNQDNFSREVLEAEGTVLVDFTAEWCGPCKKLHPILQELAQEYGERLKVGTLDVGVHASIASQYGVLSLPTVLFFRGGEVREKMVGLASKDKLSKVIDRLG